MIPIVFADFLRQGGWHKYDPPHKHTPKEWEARLIRNPPIKYQEASVRKDIKEKTPLRKLEVYTKSNWYNVPIQTRTINTKAKKKDSDEDVPDGHYERTLQI